MCGGPTSGLPSGVCGGPTSDLTSGVCGGLTSGVSGGLTSGVCGGLTSGVSGGLTSGVCGGFTSGVCGGLTSGLTSGVWWPHQWPQERGAGGMDLSWKQRESGEADEEQVAQREREQAKWLHKFYHGTPQPYLSWWQSAQRQVTLSSPLPPSPTYTGGRVPSAR